MTEAEVLRTHVDLFYGALESQDWDQLAAIYSDDYMLVRPDGSVLSKEEVLTDLRIGGLRCGRTSAAVRRICGASAMAGVICDSCCCTLPTGFSCCLACC
jgi:hypothetical protein